MAARKIIWTQKANIERRDILEYSIDRNKSKKFSIKLNKLIVGTIKQIAENPGIGRKTNLENIRVKIIRDYLLFYEFEESYLKVLTLWDGRRDENSLQV
ncbi:TPA: type II toxin-antitoxin system RelE/ParE family toxin [Elizabethkingia anophelis]|uniref:Type II toxin-antitoxin system RelE/ParE family toxin n=1 Tax=Elizabethkingia anophelis R26 TaxID=1246994 RepID=A0ABM6MSB5_9FLAO|nr:MULTISPECIES: type II toxin-antitoxin system RelE/ParE family toxin [Elizabethkingia]ATC35983.1 type II toxin-antitoxin system RelE/ParE family toxin [Elizabethkingia anophelis R26]ATC39660.1 type II toxin-antitoxin system RelE/ParE family toxin [Elizabethkingia anophelis Ag1]ATC43339.1 type II toxin-antitoxin system RelE/ParE family toxin [Elizabethkingia anophelis]ATC47015.1 type II toxin-antitoxin system RelE/ParE family toxin [Elizabethkingia anophelis]ELR79592.1 addiction module toxin,